MKKILITGALALTVAMLSLQQASAWVNFKVGAGADLGVQSGNNCFAYGLFKNGQVPTYNHQQHTPPCKDCQQSYQPQPYAPAPQHGYAPAPAYQKPTYQQPTHQHPQPTYQQPQPSYQSPQPVYQPAPAPSYAPPPATTQYQNTPEPPAYGPTPAQTQSRVPAYQYFPSYTPRR